MTVHNKIHNGRENGRKEKFAKTETGQQKKKNAHGCICTIPYIILFEIAFNAEEINFHGILIVI